MLERHVAPAVHAFVQHDAAPAAPVHAPLVQVVAVGSYKQVSESCAQVASTDALAHVFPTELQTGSVLHVQWPVPTGPVQVWRDPQATAVPHCPLLQVCTLLPEHWVALPEQTAVVPPVATAPPVATPPVATIPPLATVPPEATVPPVLVPPATVPPVLVPPAPPVPSLTQRCDAQVRPALQVSLP